jgi:hypothetical protein
MVTISRLHNGSRITAYGITRDAAIANLERSIWWWDRLAIFRRAINTITFVTRLMVSATATNSMRRVHGKQ